MSMQLVPALLVFTVVCNSVPTIAGEEIGVPDKSVAVLQGPRPGAQVPVLRTNDGLQIEFSTDGRLNHFAAADKELITSDHVGAMPVSVCDVSRGAKFVPTGRAMFRHEKNSLVFRSELADVGLDVTSRYRSVGQRIDVTLQVRNTRDTDRGLLVRFALPIKAQGWQWWDDLEATRTIQTNGTFENTRGIREFASLPEWRDKPALNIGAHSINFCSVITGPVGICYAVPLDQPRIFRTGYDANRGLFYIVYDVAMVRETQPASAAEFTFHIYQCDPKWGMRSALDRYYHLFPQFFRKHVDRQGMWMAFSKLSELDNANEFRFAFQEGAPEPGYDDQIGVYSLTYFTHAGMFANIPNYDPRTDPEPSYARQLAAMRHKFKQQTGSTTIFDTSGLFNASGKLSIKRASVYGHILAQYNLDPQLPFGRYMLQRIDRTFETFRTRRGGELDGFYYDGITTGINYRREHFHNAGYPPIWDPVAKKPLLYNFFSSVEFARAVAERLHAAGKITMMNGAMGSSFYTAPYLDVMGAETGLNINRPNFNYVRTICWQKPFVTLLKGNFSKLAKDDIADFMKRCVAYGVFPGFFDWPPSGLGPGSRYWDHAEWYERDRLNHRLYQALCQQLAEAGWEPLTLARSSNHNLVVERFGNVTDGEVLFTVLNDSEEEEQTMISIPHAALPNAPVVIDEVSRTWLDSTSVIGKRVTIQLALKPRTLMVLHVLSKQGLAQSQVRQIMNNLHLRQQMATLDQRRPEQFVHWRAARHGAYVCDRVSERSCMKLVSDSNKGTGGAMQWVMLYQDKSEPLRLRLRFKSAAGVNDSVPKLSIETLLCHVNMKTHFTERKIVRHQLKADGPGWQEEEILIKPENPLRSIQLSLYLGKSAGTVWIDRVSITPADQSDREYVVDPAMEQRYAQLPETQRKKVNDMFAQLQDRVSHLQQADDEARLKCGIDILNQAYRIEQVLGELSPDVNACRRAQRELDDLILRVSLICAVDAGIHAPSLNVPNTMVPGEQIVVRVQADGDATPSPVRLLQVSGPLRIVPGSGKNLPRVAVLEGAVGKTVRLAAVAMVHLSSGLELPMRVSAELQVVPPIEATSQLQGISAAGDQFELAVEISNNASDSVNVMFTPKLPDGWHQKSLAQHYTLEPKSKRRIAFRVLADRQNQPGDYTIGLRLSAPGMPAPLDLSSNVLFLPDAVNLLKNPGFESPQLAAWASHQRQSTIDTNLAHSGKQSLQIANNSARDQSSVSQTIVLNQDKPRPIVVRGFAKAQNVSGKQGRGFSIYVDIYYMDGSALYGQTIDWDTGTTDWQFGQTTITPAKPIRNVNVYLLLRGHSGTAWFDDLFVSQP